MPRIKVKLLEAGQQLSKDAVNASGRLLLKAGTTLETKHLEIFRTWGVAEVDIVGEECEHDEVTVSFSMLPAEEKDRIYRQLIKQFKHCNLHHPLIKELIHYQRARLTKASQSARGTPA